MYQGEMFGHAPKTLEEATVELGRKLDEGVTCPCCGQWAKRYKRHINADMARALILLANAAGGANMPVDIRKVDVRGGDYGKLRFWGLIAPAVDPSARLGARSGMWRITTSGWAFVRNASLVMDTAVVYNDRCERLEGRLVSIKDALGTKFDYEKLMMSSGSTPGTE